MGFEVTGLFGLLILIADVYAIVKTLAVPNSTSLMTGSQ